VYFTHPTIAIAIAKIRDYLQSKFYTEKNTSSGLFVRMCRYHKIEKNNQVDVNIV